MCSLTTYVGLDYHQDSVQVCVLDSQGKQLTNRSVENDSAVIERVATRHGRPARVAVEACCGSADLADELATRRGLPVELAHPGYVARLKRSPDKTDLGDAQPLADLARVNYLPKVWLAPQAIRQLRRLMRHRTQLVRRRTHVKLRIRALLRENRLKGPTIRAWTKPWLTWLTETTELSDSDRWILDDQLVELQTLGERIKQVERRSSYENGLVRTEDGTIYRPAAVFYSFRSSLTPQKTAVLLETTSLQDTRMGLTAPSYSARIAA